MDMEAADILNSQLVQRLQSIRDYRCDRGKRYPLWIMLLVSVLGAMSGAQGYRALEDFGKRHYASLCEYLGVSLKRLPSDTTLRRMFESLNMTALSEQFNAWAQAQFMPQPGECLSVDGKSLSSTLTGHQESIQNFVALVSVYSHQQRLVIAQKDYQNKQESEISVVQNLLETLEITDVTFTFDALHCQKNTSAAR
jgi:Tfp pilus assembly protein PilO